MSNERAEQIATSQRTGEHYVVDAVTHEVLRRATIDDLEAQVVTDFKNEQGVNEWQRFVCKNLATNPAACKDYLRAQGYEIRSLPESYGAWNWAVRHPADPDKVWKVIDPRGIDSQDLQDLFGDAFKSVSTTLGVFAGVGVTAPSAPVTAGMGTVLGGIAGGAVGAGLSEYWLQQTGNLAGIPPTNQFSIPAVAGEAALGAATAPADMLFPGGRGVAAGMATGARKSAEVAGDVASEFAALAIGTGKGTPAFTGGQKVVGRAAMGSGSKELLSSARGAEAFRNAIMAFLGRGAPLTPAKMAEVEFLAGAAGDLPVDISPVVDYLRQFVLRETGEMTPRTISRQVTTETASEFARTSAQEAERQAQSSLTGKVLGGVRTFTKRTKKGGRTITREILPSSVEKEVEAGRIGSITSGVTGSRTAKQTTTTTRTTMQPVMAPTGADRSSIIRAAIAPDLPKESKELIEDMRTVLLNLGSSTDFTKVPLRDAVALRQIIDGRAIGVGALDSGVRGKDIVAQEFRRAMGMIRQSIDEVADASQIPLMVEGEQLSYTSVRKTLDRQMKSGMALMDHITAGSGKEMDHVAKTETFLSEIFARERGAYLDGLHNFEKEWGLAPETLVNIAREVEIGKAFFTARGGQAFPGVVPIRPRLAATGTPIGITMLGGLGFGGGMVAGMDPAAAALTGLAMTPLGLTLGSPRTIVGLTRAGLAVGHGMSALERAAMTPAARAAGITALNEAGRAMGLHAVVTEDTKRRRSNPVVLGGL